MHRIDHPTKSTDENGTGKDGFTEGDPGLVAATVVTDDWLNGVQEELAGTIESAGVVLAKGSQGQLADALSRFFQMMAVSNWESLSVGGASQDVEAFAYDPSAGRLVAVLDNEETRYSDDLGHSWTDSGLTGSNRLRDVAYSADLGQWVAVGDGGTLYTSPDGVSWTSRTSGTAENLYAVVWNPALSLWLTVGNNDAALTSPDGINWTDRTLGASGDDYRSVAVSDGGRFLVAGDDGSNLLVWYSDDGTNWTQVAIQSTKSFVGGAAVWAGDRYVLATGGDAYESADGTSWTAHGAISNAFGSVDLIWGGGILLHVSTDEKAHTSSDFGATWKFRGYLPASALNRGGYADGRFFFGYSGSDFVRSLKGI